MSFIFDTYRDEVMALARSLVIKFDIQNTLVNDRLRARGIPVSDDPTTWKYHLNLTGQYHRNDTRMQVLSSDTQKTILFDRVVLEHHPRTRVDFALGGPFHKQLIEQYPNNRILIRGITRPLDMDTVIAAPDFTILDWDSTYIGINETPLMRDLQTWIHRFVRRWYNPDFVISDPLYPAAFFFTLNAHIPTAIMNIRLQYAKTPYAAQFHIWSYLSGHYEIDRYRAFLNNNQALWLYKNIVDIRSRAGRIDKLRAMLEQLLRPAGVRLERTEFIQTTSNLIESGQPNSYFSFTDFDSRDIDFSSGNLFTNRILLELTQDKALYNGMELESDLKQLDWMTSTRRANRTSTKLMRAFEDGSLAAQTLETVNLKMVYWVYLSAFGIYDPEITVSLPKGGSKILRWKDAFILFIHALNKSRGENVPRIPEIQVKGVVPLSYPTRNQLQRVIDNKYTTNADIDYVLSDPIDVLRIQNFSDFDRLIGDVIERRLQHELYWESHTVPIGQSLRQDLCMSTWARVNCVLARSNTTFEDWLGMQRINDSEITQREWYEIAQDILTKVIGLEQVSGNMGLRQNAMVDIIERLTSYNIMVIRDGENKRTRKIEIPNIRMHSVSGTIHDIYEILSGQRVIEIMTTQTIDSYKEVELTDFIEYDDTVNIRIPIDTGVDVDFNDRQTLTRYITGAEAHTTINEV